MVRDPFLETLNRGIQAAQAGNRMLARLQIEEALGLNPRSAVAWVWLAWTADNPHQAAHYLRKAADIAPQHPVVKAGLFWSQALEQFRLPGVAEVSESTATGTAEANEQSGSPSMAATQIPETSGHTDAAPTTVVRNPIADTTVVQRSGPRPLQPGDSGRPSDSGPLVLVVDDSPTLSRVVAAMLTRCGFRAQTVHSGQQALDAVQNGLPDLVLLDVMLPDIDGYEVCKQLKAGPATRHIPVVMLSGRDAFMDKALGRMAGCDEYLVKPFQQEQLLQTLRDLTSASTR